MICQPLYPLYPFTPFTHFTPPMNESLDYVQSTCTLQYSITGKHQYPSNQYSSLINPRLSISLCAPTYTEIHLFALCFTCINIQFQGASFRSFQFQVGLDKVLVTNEKNALILDLLKNEKMYCIMIYVLVTVKSL